MNDPKDVNNIKKKEERGVVCYHIYTFKFRGNEWIIKFEEHKKGFEHAYAIQKSLEAAVLNNHHHNT